MTMNEFPSYLSLYYAVQDVFCIQLFITCEVTKYAIVFCQNNFMNA